MGKVKKNQVDNNNNKKKEIKPLEDFFGFKVLPVLVKEGCRHYMYMKRHEVRSDSDSFPASKTLFLLNLPVDTTDAHLQYLFRSHGKIVSITYHTGSTIWDKSVQDIEEENIQQEKNESFDSILIQPTTPKDQHKKNKKKQQQEEAVVESKASLRRLLHSGSKAHIVFDQTKTLDSVMEMKKIVRHWTIDQEEPSATPLQPLGFQRYLLSFQLSRPDPELLQTQVDAYMLKFKENEYQKERELLERMNKMDEDGFVVVSRHKKKKNTDGDIHVTATSAAVAANDQALKPKKKRELVDFYRFQLREKKQNELLELRKRFEEDKRKIEKLKQSRKFKPY
ncbi:ribosomal RNA-processing protein 7-domain-containing protein [Cunninghamella echinulata]|nr:ribosomal RNA-processing protein 7-domain-containing protein [Cunninghamella echinulata]